MMISWEDDKGSRYFFSKLKREKKVNDLSNNFFDTRILNNKNKHTKPMIDR